MNTTFFGDKEFPIEWEDGQKELFWVHDDLHIPNPISPMFADIGGWWLNCDYMFRRIRHPVRLRLVGQDHQRVRLHRCHPGEVRHPR